MNILYINKGKLIYEGKIFEINDLFNEKLYKYSDNNVDKYLSDLCIINEVYMSQVQPMMGLTIFIKENKIELIQIEEIDDILYPLIVDIASTCNIKIKGISFLYKFKKNVLAHFNIISSTGYLLWKMFIIPYSDRIENTNKKFSIIRTPAAWKKMSFLEDVDIKFENFKGEKIIYNCFSRRKRVGWVLKAWVKSYCELNKYKLMVKEKIGMKTATNIFLHYSKRVVHTLLYSYMLDYYFQRNSGNTFYTGNNLDRYAILEEQIAIKHNVKTICIPHGLEYGFKLPHCFTCDIFYTTSEKSAKHLNLLYAEKKFIYNEKIAYKMFVVPYNRKLQIKKRRIVFFTEPREVYVNIEIIDELLPLLQKEKLQLSIKLHPKDKKSDYAKYKNKVNFIKNFDDAIYDNICFSRKSTILIEAVYNKSVAGALLINSKDLAVFNTFPSLKDKKIKVFYSIVDIFNWLKKENFK